MRSFRSIGVCIAVLLSSASGFAAPPSGIFVSDDPSGAIHLSDTAQGPNARLLVELQPPDAERRSDRPRAGPAVDPAVAAIVRDAARTHRLEPELLQAVIATESGYASRAMSPRGAAGLMQLMPATAREYGVTDRFDPRQNVDAGARHLRRLLDQFGQDRVLALAAYNAGAGAVVRHGQRVPRYPETMTYVPRVLLRLAALQRSATIAAAELASSHDASPPASLRTIP